MHATIRDCVSFQKRPRAASKFPRRLPGPGLSFSTSKVTPVWPKQGAIPYRAWPAIPDKQRQSTKTASGGLKMTSEAAGTRPIIFNIKSYRCMPQAGSHSIEGMAGHSGQTRKQTNKQIPFCFISIDVYA